MITAETISKELEIIRTKNMINKEYKKLKYAINEETLEKVKKITKTPIIGYMENEYAIIIIDKGINKYDYDEYEDYLKACEEKRKQGISYYRY